LFEFYGYICPIINKQTDKQIMDVPPHNDNERFRRLSLLGRIGWWEADFSAEQYLCSEYVCDLLGMKGDSLSFQDFGRMIREDYQRVPFHKGSGGIRTDLSYPYGNRSCLGTFPHGV